MSDSSDVEYPSDEDVVDQIVAGQLENLRQESQEVRQVTTTTTSYTTDENDVKKTELEKAVDEKHETEKDLQKEVPDALVSDVLGSTASSGAPRAPGAIAVAGAEEQGDTATTDGVVSANAIDEDALEVEYKQRMMEGMVEATEVTKSKVEEPSAPPNCWETYKWPIMSVCTVVGIVAVILGIVLPGKASSDSGEPPVIPATPAPTLDSYNYFRQMVLPISDAESLDEPGTPQNQALEWLALKDTWSTRATNTSALIERYVLAVLYYSTGGAEWTDDLRFLTNSSICEWPNIEADETEVDTPNEIDCDELGQVVKIRIEQNNLNGTLPSELSALSALDIMTFGNGDIYGTIPPEFGELSHLTFFQMANNHLTGSIPETFVKLSNMEVFSVFRNQLNGTIPGDFVAATFDLEIVDFALNQFVGSIPDFDNQSSLRLVFMEGNQLTGSIPNTIYSQDSLEILSLSGNQLTGAIRSQIGQLPDLFFLSLEENKFSGSLPTTLGNLLDLADLTLQDNQLTGGIPSQLGELEQIGTVNLSKNRLTGSLPQELGNMEGLKFLSVASNEITGSVPLGFSQLTALEQLFLSNTSISNGLEQAFCNQAILTTSIEADCGSEDPEIDCECCTSCCVNGNDCQLSVPSICQTQAGKFEVDPQRGASCSCSDDGTTLSCTDSTCESCNLDETACAVNTEYGYTFNVTTGSIETFQNTIEYVTGWNGTKITFVEPNEGVCQVSVNGEKCRFCGDLVCSSGFQGYSVFCDNLEGGYNFNSCDEFVVTGYLEILHVYDQSQLSGCPLLLEKV